MVRSGVQKCAPFCIYYSFSTFEQRTNTNNMEKEQVEQKQSRTNAFKRYLGAFLATLTLFVVYFIARVIKTPLWWLRIERFKRWNYIPAEYIIGEKGKQTALDMEKLRRNDMLITLVLIILTPIYIFVPLFWFLTVVGTLAIVIFIIVTFILFRIRAKRIKEKDLIKE